MSLRIPGGGSAFNRSSLHRTDNSSLTNKIIKKDNPAKEAGASEGISFLKPDSTTKADIAGSATQRFGQEFLSEQKKAVKSEVKDLVKEPLKNAGKEAIDSRLERTDIGDQASKQIRGSGVVSPLAHLDKIDIPDRIDRMPTPEPVSPAVLQKLDQSTLNTPETLAKWDDVLGDLPPAERQAKAKELNRPIVAAKMLQKGGGDALAGQAYIDATPALKTALDTGEGKGKADGKVTKKDISKFISRMEDSARKADKAIKNFNAKNPNADAQSQALLRSNAMLLANSPLLMAADPSKAQNSENQKNSDKHTIHVDDLKALAKANPQLSSVLQQSAKTWSEPGLFGVLEHAGVSGKAIARTSHDGILWQSDIEAFVNDVAPTSGAEFAKFMDKASTLSAVADVNTTRLDKDIFERPQHYRPDEKAAVLVKLNQTMEQLQAGRSIRNTAASEEALQERIDQLEADPSLQAFLSARKAQKLSAIMTSDPALAKANQARYNDIIRGDTLSARFAQAKGEGRAEETAMAILDTKTELSFQRQLHGAEGAGDIQTIIGHHPNLRSHMESVYQDISNGKFLTKLVNEKNSSLEDSMLDYSFSKGILETAMPSAMVAKMSIPNERDIHQTLTKAGVRQSDIEHLGEDVSKKRTGKQKIGAFVSDVASYAKDQLVEKVQERVTEKVKDKVTEKISKKVASKIGQKVAQRLALRAGAKVAGNVVGQAAGMATAAALGASAGPVGWVASTVIGIGTGIVDLVGFIKDQQRMRKERREFDRTVRPVLDQFEIKRP